MADINNIVTVNTTITTGGLIAREFGITLWISPNADLPASDPLRTYADLDQVEADFAAGSSPVLAATVYFGAEVTPKNLMIGRWIDTDIAAELVGGELPALATITAISDGSLIMNGQSVTAIDFSSDASYADVATTLETALLGAGVSVTVVFDSLTTSFTIETVAVGAAATLTFATTEGSGTDISDLFALSSTTAVSLSQGTDQQTIEEAFQNFQSINNIFYFVTLDSTENDTQTVIDLSTEIFDKIYFYFAESSDPQALVTNETTSTFAQLFAQQSSRTAGDWTPETSENLAIASAAFWSGQTNFEGTNSVPNTNLKNRPLIDPSILTTSQATELSRKRVNDFTPIGGGTTSQTVSNVYQFGYMFQNGIWQDIRYGVDWLSNAIQVAVLDLLIEVNRTPQTIEGQALIKETIETVCKQGITNGLLAPGIVSAPTKSQIISITGNSLFNGTLALGFLVFPQPLSTLSTQDRNARKMPPFYVWTKGSGAVNSVDINLIFDQ
ncbi:MAG: DUF3383 family protein [Gammaproteobacteria bacterium]